MEAHTAEAKEAEDEDRLPVSPCEVIDEIPLILFKGSNCRLGLFGFEHIPFGPPTFVITYLKAHSVQK
jgi:hypothetical protein